METVSPSTGFSERNATQANNKTAIPNKVRRAPKKRLNCVLSILINDDVIGLIIQVSKSREYKSLSNKPVIELSLFTER